MMIFASMLKVNVIVLLKFTMDVIYGNWITTTKCR